MSVTFYPVHERETLQFTALLIFTKGESILLLPEVLVFGTCHRKGVIP